MSVSLCFYVVLRLCYIIVHYVICEKKKENTVLDELCVTCTLFSLYRLLETSAFLSDLEHATVKSENVDRGNTC